MPPLEQTYIVLYTKGPHCFLTTFHYFRHTKTTDLNLLIAASKAKSSKVNRNKGQQFKHPGNHFALPLKINANICFTRMLSSTEAKQKKTKRQSFSPSAWENSCAKPGDPGNRRSWVDFRQEKGPGPKAPQFGKENPKSRSFCVGLADPLVDFSTPKRSAFSYSRLGFNTLANANCEVINCFWKKLSCPLLFSMSMFYGRHVLHVLAIAWVSWSITLEDHGVLELPALRFEKSKCSSHIIKTTLQRDVLHLQGFAYIPGINETALRDPTLWQGQNKHKLKTKVFLSRDILLPCWSKWAKSVPRPDFFIFFGQLFRWHRTTQFSKRQ